MNPSSQKFKTTDLTLSTFLRLRGCDAVPAKDGERKGGHPVGAWTFAASPELQGLIKQYEAGQAKVEPKTFHDAINRYREELFTVLGIGRKQK